MLARKVVELEIADSVSYQTVRRTLKATPTSVDLQRVEFALLVRGLGLPFVQMLHGEGAPKLQMISRRIPRTGRDFSVSPEREKELPQRPCR